MKTSLQRVASAAAVAGLVACGRAPASRFPTADDALERMHATYACSRGIEGEAGIDYFGPEGRVRGDVYYLAVLPEQLRFDVVSPFGVVLATLTADGEEFALYDVSQGVQLRGPATTCNVARFTQVSVPPFALVQLLRGEAPVLVHRPESVHIRWRQPLTQPGYYVVRIASQHQSEQEIRLRPLAKDLGKPWQEQRVEVLKVVVRQAGAVLYSAEMRGHRAGRTARARVDPDGIGPDLPPSGPPCSAPVPGRLRLFEADGAQELIVSNARIGTDVVHNPPYGADAFVQAERLDVRTVYAACE
ncbi:MAG: hypothetical protein JW751_24160 [Polyangiaceae bacterium]|nr:hypothetical protein [Polyangiaceae bacterium]